MNQIEDGQTMTGGIIHAFAEEIRRFLPQRVARRVEDAKPVPTVQLLELRDDNARKLLIKRVLIAPRETQRRRKLNSA
jgi:hypothetical protein